MISKNLYIAALEPYAGSIIVTMGIMELLKSRIEKIAFFRPVIDSHASANRDIAFMLSHFKLTQPIESCYGFELSEAETLLSEGRENDLIERLIGQYRLLEEEYDFIIIEGLERSSFDKSVHTNLNLKIAKNLRSPYVSILNAKGRTQEQIEHDLAFETAALRNEHLEHLAVFVNRLDPIVRERLEPLYQESSVPHFFMSEIEELDLPSVGEVKETLGCRQILGSERDLDRIVRRVKIAAMNIEHLLERLEDGDLVIAPGDRNDIILGVLGANYAKNFPIISGIILSGGYTPGDIVLNLLSGLDFLNIPVLSTEKDTYQTATEIDRIRATISPHHERKIALAVGEFMSSVESEVFYRRIHTVRNDILTPIMFEYSLYERARSNRRRIVLPESDDERILRAAEILLRRNVVDIILLGDPENILHHAATLGLDLSRATIIDPDRSPLMGRYVDDFYELRREKGLSLNGARDSMAHANYFGTMMVHHGDADGMVSGAVHTTQDTVRPALQIIKTGTGISRVSSLFFMCLDTKVLVYADCAVIQDPTAEELADIAILSAQTAQLFGIEPRIAMLSYSTGDSGKGEDVMKVRQATELVQQRRPDLPIEGPIQYDAAIDPDVAKIKLPGSDVAGKATIFIFPDLNTGNNTYKAVQRTSGAVAIGPILQGLKKPVNDLSRGCEIADIVNTILITAVQAQGVAL